jgi:hypothetical protein
MFRMSKIAVMVMLGGSLLASGCCNAVSEKIAEKAAEKVVEKAVGGDATVSKGGVTVKTDKGSLTAGASAKLPDNWPKDVPLIAGAKIVSSMGMEASSVVSFQSAMMPEQIVAYYKALPGWSQASSMDTPEMKMLVLRNGKRTLSVTASREAGGALSQGQVTHGVAN